MDALLRPERAIELLLTKKRQGIPLHRLPVPAPSSSNAAGLHHIALSPSSLRRWRCPALALGSRPALPCLMGRTRIQSTVDVPSTTNLGRTCSIQHPEGAQGWTVFQIPSTPVPRSVFGVPSSHGCRKDALAPLHAVTRRRAPRVPELLDGPDSGDLDSGEEDGGGRAAAGAHLDQGAYAKYRVLDHWPLHGRLCPSSSPAKSRMLILLCNARYTCQFLMQSPAYQPTRCSLLCLQEGGQGWVGSLNLRCPFC